MTFPHYHNTTNLRGSKLTKAKKQAGKQNDAILALFQDNPGQEFTPFEVHQRVFYMHGVPLTSTRRAISDLTKAGKLEKTDNQKDGPYGRPVFTWKLATGEN